jgi:VWFA-related protein
MAIYREQQIAQNSLRNFADQTGGLAWVGSGNFASGFRQIVDDNSRYYMLGYYSNDPRLDGKFRSLNVRVNRPGATVRTRKGYYALASSIVRTHR